MIGLADSEDGEINDIFARILLCREKITNFAISSGVNNDNEQHMLLIQSVDKMRFVHAGPGLKALSRLQKHVNSVYCRAHVG